VALPPACVGVNASVSVRITIAGQTWCGMCRKKQLTTVPVEISRIWKDSVII